MLNDPDVCGSAECLTAGPVWWIQSQGTIETEEIPTNCPTFAAAAPSTSKTTGEGLFASSRQPSDQVSITMTTSRARFHLVTTAQTSQLFMLAAPPDLWCLRGGRAPPGGERQGGRRLSSSTSPSLLLVLPSSL